MRKVIITCAVTGAAPVSPKYPPELNFPITPAQIAADAIASARAGAAIAHIHARDPKTGAPTRDFRIYKEICDRIRDSGVDVIINLTCGHAAIFCPDPQDESRAGPGTDMGNVDERVRHIEECLPDICSLDVTTGNQVEAGFEFVYLNTPRTLKAMAERFRALGVKPEIEVFQAGDILLANHFHEQGLFEDPPLYQLVLGVKWGAPATSHTMTYMRDLLPPGAVWAGFGISRLQMPMAAQAVLLGGNVRVGLEDNIYLRRGEFATNVQLVERAVQIVELLGETPASPAEAREILGLPLKPTAHSTMAAA